MNYSPINQQLSYASSQPIPASSSLLKEDVYRAKNLKGNYDVNSLNLSYDAKQEFSPYNNQNLVSTALKGMIEQNPVNKLFFSSENIQRIQKKIKIAVYEKSNGKFKLDEDQDESDLLIVMRSVYFDRCKNLPDNPVRQVKKLNEQVVDYLLPDLLTNIRQYYGYIRDISTPLTPPMRPISTSSSGRRILPSYTNLWK
jgi:hypothetical protein